jgi:catechol 2,3-dioxygenase
MSKPGLSLRWGLPPQECWFTEATPFSDVPVLELPGHRGPMGTLENYLAEKARARAAT